jgi:shikimate kinase
MDYMNRQGKTIFLDADVDTLTSRVLRAKDKRPLLSGLDDGEVRNFVEQHLKKRMEYYLKAQEIWEV